MNLPNWTTDSAADYHARKEFLSSGMIAKGVQSLAHLREHLDHPPETTTPAFLFGGLVHTAVLEPQLLSLEYAEAPQLDRRTKAGKDAWAEFEAKHAGKRIVDADDYQAALKIAESVHRHPIACELLAGATIETSIYWEDATTGVKCKARPDAYNPSGILIDLKTTQDAGPAFIKSIFNFSYHRQLAHYQAGLEAVGHAASRVVIVAVEKTPPHQVGCFELDAACLSLGRAQIAEFLPRYAEALKSGRWPGYPAEMTTVTPPAWAF